MKKPLSISVCSKSMSYYSPTANSRTLSCDPTNKTIDHNVLLVGYTETEWIIKNSWGTGWGLNGYGYISRNPDNDCCISS